MGNKDRSAMKALKIIFLDKQTIPDSISFPELNIPHEIIFHDSTAAEDVSQRIAGFDVVITNKVPITAATINNNPTLKMIAVAATGCDNVDLTACKEHNITVSNVRNYAVKSVPEHTFALILALKRNLIAYKESIGQGRWLDSGSFCYFDFPIQDLADSSIAIIGNGSLGQAVASLARAFGMQVQIVNRASYSKLMPNGQTEFQHILQNSDIISLHCPLTESTQGLIGAAEFKLMAKRKPILINTARGGLVDEQALVQAFESGLISGAGFDVVSKEPMPAKHPFNNLLKYPNFILSPHVAWSSNGAINNLVQQVQHNIESFYAGNPVNVVSNT